MMISFDDSGNVPDRSRSVLSTGVPLSERFKNVRSHNALRPNFEMKRVVSPDPDLDDDVGDLNSAGVASYNAMSRAPYMAVQRKGLGLGQEVNKLAVMRASKDAEILQLQRQVLAMNSKLTRLVDDGLFVGAHATPKSQMKNRVSRRGGGGLVLGNRGKRVNLNSEKALAVLGIGIQKIKRNPRSPMKTSNKRSARLNFFGTPKSKEDLDDELDQYMSKSKSKQKTKTDLDKEIDAYMTVARARSFAAGKAVSDSGDTIVTPASPLVEDTNLELEDTEMEIVESL